MGIDEVINKFCSQPIARREHVANAKTSAIPGRSHRSQCSHQQIVTSNPKSTYQLVEEFIDKAAGLGVDLSWDDQRWLKNMLWDVNMADAHKLLCQYYIEWCDGAAAEKMEHKKCNAGRLRANTFLRETLSSMHQWRKK